MPAQVLGLPLVWLTFACIIFAAQALAQTLKKKHNPELVHNTLTMMGSLYIFTTALILSYYVNQVNQLVAATTSEIIAINHLNVTLSALPKEQRIEGRRLLFDYAQAVAKDESQTSIERERSEKAETAVKAFQHFAGTNGIPSKTQGIRSPAITEYNKNINEFTHDLIQQRERRISLSRHFRPKGLWLAIAAMFFTLCKCAFLIQSNGQGQWILMALLAAGPPVPSLLLYIYSNPLAFGLVDIAEMFNAFFAIQPIIFLDKQETLKSSPNLFRRSSGCQCESFAFQAPGMQSIAPIPGGSCC